MADTKDEIFQTLDELHAAQEAQDVDGMLKAYATDGFVSASDMRGYFEDLIERDAFRDRTVDVSACETFIYGDSALVKPVIYHTRRGPSLFLVPPGQAGRRGLADHRQPALTPHPLQLEPSYAGVRLSSPSALASISRHSMKSGWYSTSRQRSTLSA